MAITFTLWFSLFLEFHIQMSAHFLVVAGSWVKRTEKTHDGKTDTLLTGAGDCLPVWALSKKV